MGRIPRFTSASLRFRVVLALSGLVLLGGSGCATMRCKATDPYHRPCAEGFARTADGWKLGIRRVRPFNPDPGKLPVVLCHGLGLNGTFWTITDDHLPLIRKGLRVIDVIDIDYCSDGGIDCGGDSRNLHHTMQDTIDNVSAKSLQIVGDVALTLITRQ